MNFSFIVEQIWNAVYLPDHKLSMEDNIAFYNFMYNTVIQSTGDDVERAKIVNDHIQECAVRLFTPYYETLVIQLKNNCGHKTLSEYLFEQYNLCNQFVSYLKNVLCCVNYLKSKIHMEQMILEMFHIQVLQSYEHDVIQEIIAMVKNMYETNTFSMEMIKNIEKIFTMLLIYNESVYVTMAEQYQPMIISHLTHNIHFPQEITMNTCFTECKKLIGLQKKFEFLIRTNFVPIVDECKNVLQEKIHSCLFPEMTQLIVNKECDHLTQVIKEYFQSNDWNHLYYKEEVFQRVNQYVNQLHQQLKEQHSDILMFFRNEVIPYSQLLLNLEITSTLTVCNEGIDNVVFLSLLTTDMQLSQEEFEQILVTYFTVLFPKITSVDEFLFHYNQKFYRKILHRKVIRSREEIIYFHFAEKIQMNGELYRYKMLYNDCFGITPEWQHGMLLSNIYWHDRFQKMDMIYHPLLQSHLRPQVIEYLHLYPDRELYVDSHYSMTKLRLNEQEMCISMCGANLLLFGNEIGFENLSELSTRMNVSENVLKIWISHLLKYGVLRKGDQTGMIEFGNILNVVPTPSYSQFHYDEPVENTRHHVIEKRPEIIDAFIVKTLKQKITLSKSDLYQWVKKEISYFMVTMDDFEKELGILEKKEYLTQEGDLCSYVI